MPLERHRRGENRVIPIILRPCDWQHTPLKDLQCLPRDARPVTQWPDQDEVFNAITQSLRRIIEQVVAHPPIPLTPLNRQNRIRMLRQVRAIWIDGLLTQSLHHAARIELSLQDRPDVLANPWRLQVQELHQSPQILPDGTSIVQVYDRAEGELLILGEPGAGKVTLLLELTRTLLERAEQDERLRIPIVFHLSSWAEKRQSLRTWLVEELATKYQVPRKIGRSWIDADQVLPLLDGLDEVAKDARTACVEQINDYYQSRLEHGSSPIVVCCRSEEYAALSTRILLQHAVSILPLTDEQINAYLEQAGEQVEALKAALDEDAELHSLARQPLMLSVFLFAYQGARASEVPVGETREEMQRAIFARYVEHMLKRRGQSKRWKPERVIRWLTFLARQMQLHDQSVFSIEDLQPSWLSLRRWRIRYQWCVGLIVELVVGLITWPLAGLVFGLGSALIIKPEIQPDVIRPIFQPTWGLVVGLGVGLIVALIVADTRIDPAEVLTWSWQEARSGLVFGLGLGLVVSLGWWLTGVQLLGLDTWLTFWSVVFAFWSVVKLFAGLTVGLAFGLAVLQGFWLSGRQLPERLSPNEGIWRSGKNGLVVALVIALIAGLGSGLGGGPFFGLVVGLAAGLLGGLFVGLAPFVKRFILRIFLSLRGDLPWHLVPFLDEAAERLLLRKVGGSYIFVHRQLLDYFADLAEYDD